MFNFLRTARGYLISLVQKYTGLPLTGKHIGDIFNYLPITEDLVSSGQPTARQFAAIRAAGFTTVINLLPAGIENAIRDEGPRVRDLGMTYVHIPVLPFKPTEDNFKAFTRAMAAAEGEKIWVHCAANCRASAFLYRYRTEVLGQSPDTAKWDVREIWEPFGVWKRFISWDKS